MYMRRTERKGKDWTGEKEKRKNVHVCQTEKKIPSWVESGGIIPTSVFIPNLGPDPVVNMVTIPHESRRNRDRDPDRINSSGPGRDGKTLLRTLLIT